MKKVRAKKAAKPRRGILEQALEIIDQKLKTLASSQDLDNLKTKFTELESTLESFVRKYEVEQKLDDLHRAIDKATVEFENKVKSLIPKNEIDKIMSDARSGVEDLRSRLISFTSKTEFEELKKKLSKLEENQAQFNAASIKALAALEGITNELRAVRQDFAQKEGLKSLTDRIKELELKVDQMNQAMKKLEESLQTIPIKS